MAPGKLESLMMEYKVPCIVDLVVLSPYEGAVDSKGFALYLAMFSSGLRLSFCHPVHDVLDFMGVAPTQLHPNAWRVVVCCCVIWQCTSKAFRSDQLDLTA